MAKESTSSRIPMPGISRIPLRPPTALPLSRTSQLRAPTTFAKIRPIPFSGLRPPVHHSMTIKKSISGDRINTLSKVSKTTTTAFKKFFTKGEQTTTKKDAGVMKKLQNETAEINFPQNTLARSETFVRSESAENLTFTPKARALCESTPLIGTNTKQGLYATKCLDSTFVPNIKAGISSNHQKDNLENTRISNISFSNTIVIESPKNKTKILNAVDIDSPRNVTSKLDESESKEGVSDGTQTLGNVTENRSLNKTHSIKEPTRSDATSNVSSADVLDRTLCVMSPKPGQVYENVPRALDSSQLLDKLTNVTVNHAIDGAVINTKLSEYTDILSPATNATYSYPGSSENLLMIDDVSIPSGFEEDVAMDVQKQLEKLNHQQFPESTTENLDCTLTEVAPNKANMKLPLNSNMNSERLLDPSQHMTSQAKHMQMSDLTKDCIDTSIAKNGSHLLYVSQISSSCSTTPDRKKMNSSICQLTSIPAHLNSHSSLKGAQSDLVLPIRTPEEDAQEDQMDIDATLVSSGERTEVFYQQSQATTSLQDVNNPNKRGRFSFGLDLTESTLDCSIELVDVSLSSTVLSQALTSSQNCAPNLAFSTTSTQQMQQQFLKKQNSFEMDESLGILTPDQMKEFLDSTATNNTNNLDLPLLLNNSNSVNNFTHKLALQQMRIDQTPSPEELPLDPVEVKTDINDMVLQHQQLQLQQQHQNLQSFTSFSNDDQQQHCLESLSLHTDTEPSKTETINKSISSSVSKISTSFITSVTSVTSLDTGYQGDGEMSRPASRGPCDHSPSNGPIRKGVSRQPSFNQQQGCGGNFPPVRRQDPMTDSDFFTESDADDVFHRGDRRAQVIDGQLYGPMLQPATSVFISEDPQMEDSCMESSGIFTDVENRGDEDLAQMRMQDTQVVINDFSPDNDLDGDDSTETVKSNRDTAKRYESFYQCNEKSTATTSGVISTVHNSTATHGQGHLSNSQTSSTFKSSMSTDHLSTDTLSNRTSYCSVDGSNVNINGVGVDFKSFSSLDEAFNEENNKNININNKHNNNEYDAAYMPVKLTKSSTTSTTSWCEQPMQKQLKTVLKQTSPRKHSSLTSLTTENGVHSKTTTKQNNATTLLSLATQNQFPNSRKHSDQDSLRYEAGSVSGTGSKSSINENIKLSKTSSSTTSDQSDTPKSAKLRSGSRQSNSNKNSSSPVVRKYHPLPNKWEAVMNQIANNKSVIRKNYNDVKSKVSTRVTTTTGAVSGASTGSGGASGSSASVSPTQRRSPSNNLNRNIVGSSVSKVSKSNKLPLSSSSPHASNLDNSSTKRLLQNGHTNRGRSYSKDSQKSSQSDLSLVSANGSSGAAAGSTKSLAKTPMRAAKKRDVHNLSISPTDLGPPPKTQQTANGSSTRPKPAIISLTQKRFTSNVQSNSLTTPSATSKTASNLTGGSTISVKGSPPLKKVNIHTKRLDPKAVTEKAPLKDHNRILNQTSATSVGNNKTIGKPEASLATTSGQQENNDLSIVGGINNNNNINEKASATNTRTNSRTSSPTIQTNATTTTTITNNKKNPASPAATASNTNEKKLHTKLQNSSNTSSTSSISRKLLLQKQHEQLPEDAVVNNSSEELIEGKLQQLKCLNRHSYNGTLNYQTFEQQQQQLQELRKQAEHHTKSTEALAVLLQYLVYDLDAFACPSLKTESLKTKEKLQKTLFLLDEAKNVCSELQEQLGDKDAYYIQRENELQALHRCELEKAQTNFMDFQTMAKQQITSLENQLQDTESENKRLLEAYRFEIENKLSQKQQQLEAAEQRAKSLNERVQALEVSEQQFRDQLTQTESLYAGRVQAAAEREHELNESLKQLTKELDKLKALKDNNERDLMEKLNLSNDEVAVLRTCRKSLNESGVSSPRNSSLTSSAYMELSRLQSEAESLRCVLELKQKEISKLTKQNEELLRDADEKLSLQTKISLLESKSEMLHSELAIKSDKEKEYLRQIDEIQKAYNHETVKRTRLSYDNEALQWQLKQRSEQLHIVETKLQELSAHDTSASSVANRSSQNGTLLTSSIHMDDISPPTSPVIKGVIEKTDSVSWVLEMDDETPEAAASKMVKRAGSFRSVERSPSARKQLSVSASAACGGTTSNLNSSSVEVSGPNPLSQSMSATSVIREHSKVETSEFHNRSHARTRSKSVSVKGCDGFLQAPKLAKKVSRHLSVNSCVRKNELTANWKESVITSSPYNMRPRSSTLKNDNESEEVLFRRSSASKLITCDTSALNKGERLELRSLPSHPSVQDLKAMKKCQEIQESAGEAMVSGTNSEDESCSASSDDVVSSASSSVASDSTASSNQLKSSRMSLEEVLLIEKINSLSGTPMEISWSEDAEGTTNNSNL